METQLLTANQVADRLQIAVSTVYAWLREGRISGIRLGRQWRVSEQALGSYVSRQEEIGAEISGRRRTGGETLLEILADVTRDIPPEAWAELPPNASLNIDHYLYGAPKVTRRQ